MAKVTVGFAMCGSFCTFSKALPQMEALVGSGYEVLPIMSSCAYNTDTRFGRAEDFIYYIETLTDKKIIHSIEDAEPIGPKKLCDIMVVAPCTGNTMAKLANGITDTPVTMAVKSHLRAQRPVLLAPATNDALGASAKNIGALLNTKNIFFVPMSQDDPENKPTSLVSRFEKIPECVENALTGKQTQPIL